MQYVSYLIAIIAFIFVVKYAMKVNQGAFVGNLKAAEAQNPFPEFAKAMGLTYENNSTQSGLAGGADKKLLQNINHHMFGEYKGVVVDWRIGSYARESEKTPLTATYSYEHSNSNKITFTVKNSGNKQFEIMKKSEHIVAKPTGNSQFDSKLSLTGDAVVPADVLSYFGSLGWIDLKLVGTALVYNDSFYEQPQFKGLSAYSNIMSAVHPVWGTSISKTAMDTAKGQLFFDKMTELAISIV